MSCCAPAGYRTVFGTGMAERDARRYGRKGLRGSARRLTNQVAGRGVKGRSILEIGGGIGDIQLERCTRGQHTPPTSRSSTAMRRQPVRS